MSLAFPARLRWAALVAIMTIGACAPASTGPRPEAGGLPPVPRVDGPLAVRVVYPTSGTPLPRVDSTFVFGSVGSGSASLTINGAPVEVAPNGAFLAFVAVPADGRYQLTAERRGETAQATVAYRLPPPPPTPDSIRQNAPADSARATVPSAPAVPAFTPFPQPLSGVVTGVRDTLATGSDVAPGFPAPTTDVDRRWFFPRGTRITAVGRQGRLIQARLNGGASAWISDTLVTLGTPAPGTPTVVGAVAVRSATGHADVRIPAAGAPFLIREEPRSIAVTLYGVTVPAGAPNLTGEPLLAGGEWGVDSAGVPQLRIRTRPEVWGYKVFYEADGTLVLRVRRPPAIDANQPLRGLRIMVDAGHPPGGAIGPTGLTEAEANLAIALRLADKLRARGADVRMTRTANVAVELSARVQMAVDADAHMLVSVHNNAFADGTNPFRNHGTSVLYFHPHSLDFAQALDREIVALTRVPDLGARYQNIAIGRVTWMPSVITESLFMMFPQQEAALRDPRFQDRLADAHVRGIEAFLRQRAAGSTTP